MMIVIEFAMSLFDCVLGAYFVSKFNGRSINPKQNIFSIPAILIVFVFLILSYYLFPNHSIVPPLIILILCSAYGVIISNKNYVRGAISGVLFATYVVLLSAFTYSVFFVLINNGSLIAQGTLSLERILFLSVNKVALTSSVIFALHYINKDVILDVKSGILILIISIMSTLSLYSFIGNVQADSEPNIKIQTLIFSFSFVVINTLILLLIYQINRLNKNNYDLKLMAEKMEAESSKNSEIKKIYEDISLIRHDTNQHLTIINDYLNKGDIEGCRKYIDKLWPKLSKTPNILQSGNKTLDSIINSKIALLDDTKFIITGNVDMLKNMKEEDIVSLFGNILDNAIEATRKAPRKLIELRFTSRNSNNIIICKNTTEYPVLENNKDLVSTKQDSKSHGYGIKIINKIVSDYNGILDFFEEDDMFGIEIAFPESK